MPHSIKTMPRTVQWIGDLPGHVRVIDQTLLPTQLEYRDCRTVQEVWEAIRMLRVRGAPAIGVAAAMGVVVGMQNHTEPLTYATHLKEVTDYLRTSRPTAVNLFWALERLEKTVQPLLEQPSTQILTRRLLTEALLIEQEDRQMFRAIGKVG